MKHIKQKKNNNKQWTLMKRHEKQWTSMSNNEKHRQTMKTIKRQGETLKANDNNKFKWKPKKHMETQKTWKQ